MLADGLVAELRRQGVREIVAATGSCPEGARHLPVERPEGVMGLTDAARAWRTARRARDRLVDWAHTHRPRLLVTVDAPTFTLGVSKRLRPLPAVHVVAPQVWAWRSGRVRSLAQHTDAILCLLPFEPPWFAGFVRAVYVGHPAADLLPRPVGPRPAVALLPGSRPSELRRLRPVLAALAARLQAREPGLALLTVRAPGSEPLGIPAVTEVPDIASLAGVRGAVAASGTVTLQLQALGIPQVVVAATDAVSWVVGRRVVRTPWLALPNLLAGRRVVAEHVQQLDPDAILADLDRARPVAVPDLRGPEAFGRMADEIVRRLEVA